MSSSMYGASVEYALHSLLIMHRQGERVSVRDLAQFQQLPERFLAKIFTKLRKAGIVDGTVGISGGFIFARSPEQITIMDVLEAVDPNRSVFVCAEIRRNCEIFDSKPPAWSVAGTCGIHLVMQEAEAALRSVLTSRSIADLGCGFEHKAPKTFLQNEEVWFKQSRINRIRKTTE